MNLKHSAILLTGLFCAGSLSAQTRAPLAPETKASRKGADAASAKGGKAAAKSTGNYQADAVVVLEAQEEALEMLQAMVEKATDPKKLATLQNVEKEMEKAIARLTAATNSPATLPDALAAEQAAYSALLKLAAREYSVTQNRGKKGGGGGGDRNQKQVDQLDLKMTENRYESQQQASAEQNAERREQLATLSRLQELARRQQDMNERLKELQTALQEAKTDQEREDIRRRLKRLQEQEQQMLADIDEMKQRMDKQDNQSRMAEARKQLEQVRSEVQQANNAMEKGSVPQALASGTRAQRDLQEMRDDLRKKNSNQFSEDMRQLRDEARDLAQKEEEIGKKLDSATDTKRKSLSDAVDKKELAGQLDEQKKRMENLMDHATKITEQAENVEPLLSKQLYDTIRKHSQDEVKNLKDTTEELVQSGKLTRSVYDLLKKGTEEGGNKSLEITAEMLRNSYVTEAGTLERKARKEIQNLKQGVERAAESVLGDETEALRLARTELDALAEQLNREISQGESAGKPGESKPGEQATGSNGKQPGKQASSKDGKEGEEGKQGESGKGSGGKAGKEGKDGKEQSEQMADGKGGGQQGKGDSQKQGESKSASGQGGGGGGSQGQANRDGSKQASARAGANQRGGGGGRAGGADWGGFFNGGGYGGGGYWGGPILGDDYGPWTGRLRDVGEMIDQPELRAEIERILERTRTFRNEARRDAKKPDWAVVKLKISEPLAEVRNRVNEELARRESKESLVPIDRDPVPGKFSELVRRYYEQLGSEK